MYIEAMQKTRKNIANLLILKHLAFLDWLKYAIFTHLYAKRIY